MKITKKSWQMSDHGRHAIAICTSAGSYTSDYKVKSHSEKIASVIVTEPTLYHHTTKNVATLCRIK